MTLRASVPIWTRNFISLCLANLALFMSMHMLTPTLPLYLLQVGGSQMDVGYVMGAYTVGAMAMRPFAGRLVDRWGRKKIMVLSLLAALVITLFYRFAKDVPLLLAIRGLHGMAFGMVGTAIGTMVADSLPVDRFGEGIGYFGLTPPLSLAITPVIGFWLVGRSGFPVLFLAVTALAALAFCCSIPVRSADDILSEPVGPVKEIWSSLLEKTALPASGVMFFVAVVHSAVLSFIALYAAEKGVANIGAFFTANALAMLITRPLAGPRVDRGGVAGVLVIAHLALLTGMVAVGLSGTIGGFLLAGVLLGLGLGFFIPTLQTLAMRYVPAHRRGAATGTFFLSIDTGIGLGTVLWGCVAEAAGYQIMFFATLIPLVLAGVISYRMRNLRRHIASDAP